MRDHQRYLEAPEENIAFDLPAMDAAAMDMNNLNAGGMDYYGSDINQPRSSVWRENDDHNGGSQGGSGGSAVGSWALGP